MEKLYYSSYNAKSKYEWFAIVLRVVICFIILTDLTELSIEVCVDEVIKDRGGLDMRKRKRGKSSSLGIPEAPQVNIQGDSSVQAWGCPGRHPLFCLQSIGNFTRSYIFIRHMICANAWSVFCVYFYFFFYAPCWYEIVLSFI